jgi:hypothetical protein
MHPPLQQVGRSKYPAREKSHPNLATPKTPEPCSSAMAGHSGNSSATPGANHRRSGVSTEK